MTAEAGVSYGPHQLADRLGLYRGEVDRARELGLLPTPDAAGGRWSAAAADGLAGRLEQLREQLAAAQELGAVRCAARLAEATGLPVVAEDIEILAEQGLLAVAGRYKDRPLYRVTDVDAFAGTDTLAQETAAEAERRARAARRDADEQIRAATNRLAEAERDRGHAQATAAAALATAAEETRRREHADAEIRALHEQLDTARATEQALRDHLDTARGTEADLRTELAQAQGRAELAQAEHTRLHEQVATLTAQAEAEARDRQELLQRVTDGMEAAQQMRETDRAEITALADEATRLRQDLTAAHRAETTTTAAAQAATDRLAVAEARVDQLLAALRPTPQPGPADPGGTDG